MVRVRYKAKLPCRSSDYNGGVAEVWMVIRTSQEIQQGSVVSADVCIVGGGMSGISIALRLQGKGRRVVLLEAGDEEPDDEIQDLAAGENAGLPYFDLRDARPRMFGGSTNYWGGWCRPIDRDDLDARSWIPHSGWPIAWTDLEEYVQPAMELCEIPDASFDPDDWRHVASDVYQAPFTNGKVQATVWVGSPPTKFADRYSHRLAADDDTDVVLRANVTELVTDEAGTAVKAARVRTVDGHAFEVRARVFVLAAGAIETARLLLHSKQGQRQGIGNEYDVVGRYFMEHPHVVTGRLEIFDRSDVSRERVEAIDAKFLRGIKARLEMERPTAGVKFAYTLDRDTMREYELLNWSAHLRTVADARGGPEVYHSMKLLVGNFRSLPTFLRQIREGRLPRGLGHRLQTVFTHPDDVARILYQQLIRRPRVLEIYSQSEQRPNAASRVTLAAEKDALGVPRARLEWRLTEEDKRSIRVSQQVLSDRLEAVGVGRIRNEQWLDDPDAPWGEDLQGGFHHLGTARMGSDPKTSVVDASAKVHSVSNLYVGDTSVFPTGGYANPLLTGLMLALRTADVVHRELSRQPDLAAA